MKNCNRNYLDCKIIYILLIIEHNRDVTRENYLTRPLQSSHRLSSVPAALYVSAVRDIKLTTTVLTINKQTPHHTYFETNLYDRQVIWYILKTLFTASGDFDKVWKPNTAYNCQNETKYLNCDTVYAFYHSANFLTSSLCYTEERHQHYQH